MGYLHTVKIDNGVPYLIQPNVYATATGTSTALIAGVTDFSLFSGAYVHVKVGDVINNATLNVNGTGAKAIYYDGSPITTGTLTSDHIYTFVYTGTNWELIGDITNKNILIGTTAEWASQQSLRPPVGTILVFTDYTSYTDENDNIIAVPGIKISDGSTPTLDLPLIGDHVKIEVMNALNQHINDNIRHVSQNDRDFWDNKLNCNDSVTSNNLIFNRN